MRNSKHWCGYWTKGPVSEGGGSTALKGYSMGGKIIGYATTSVIEDLIFSNETSQAIVAILDTAKGSGAGVNSSTKGYIMGGFTETATPAGTTIIDEFLFSNERRQAIAATLDTAKGSGAGVNSSTKGYIMGGYTTSSTAVIEDLIFSNETSQAITATLDTAKYGGAGVNSGTKGYIMGGSLSGITGYTNAPVAVIEDLIFADETSQVIAATLDTAKYGGAGINSSAKSYIVGGRIGGYSDTTAVIEDLIFSNETSQAITATLDTAKEGGTGVNSSSKGYIMGGAIIGEIPIKKIEDLIFADETSQVIAATLDTAKYGGAGVQSGSV